MSFGIKLAHSGQGLVHQTPFPIQEPSKDGDGYTLTTLDELDPMYKGISIDFENAGLTVSNVQKLNNHHLWQEYTSEKKSIENRTPRDPAFRINERYLYHGTRAKEDYICTEGLDARLCKHGRFGKGIYFSDNPLKCVKYAEKTDNEPTIVLARVILGCTKVYPKGKSDRNLDREPEKDGCFKGWRFYDSVEGNPKDYKEFVVYRNNRLLIECVIRFCKSKSSSEAVLSKQTSLSYTSLASPSKKNFPVGDHFASKKTLSHEYYDSDSGSSGDENEEREGGSSDSDNFDKADGYSSDSSIEDGAVSSRSVKKIKNPQEDVKKTGEEVLMDKKRAFLQQTGEHRSHIVESYLSKAGLDVDLAVKLFNEKENKLQEKEEEQRKQETKSKESLKNEKKEEMITPLIAPDKWNSLCEGDKDAIIQALTDDFLGITCLENSIENRRLGRKILSTCDYDLSLSVVAYYESV